MQFSNNNISITTLQDVNVLQHLLNSAYRGEASRKGWTTEAHLIEGDTRATPEQITEVLNTPGSVILKYTTEEGRITGCVNLQKHDNRVYPGMFAVSPEIQGGGIGNIRNINLKK